MATLVKQWADGGNLTATYEGSGKGTAIIESDENLSTDERTMTLTFADVNRGVFVNRLVRQKGREGASYTEIEYVTFDGTKVFDTNIKGNNKTTLEFKFKRTNVTSPTYLLGYGASTTSDLNVYLNSNGKWRYGNYAPIVNTRNTNVFVAEMAPTRYTINGEVSTFSNYNFTTAGTIAVGGSKTSSGSYGSVLYRGYIYYFRMSINGVLVADWIPVRKADGTECFFDKVTNDFIMPIDMSQQTLSLRMNVDEEDLIDENDYARYKTLF